METDTRKVTVAPVRIVTLPRDLVTSLMGPYFMDSLPLPSGSSYASAALLCNRTAAGTTFGAVAWSADGYLVQMASESMDGYTAACGLGGGMVGLATKYRSVPLIEIHNTPVAADDWSLAGTIPFYGVNGTIQAMAQQGNLLYGFIKGSPKNASFIVEPTNGATPSATYYDDPEAAFAHLPQMAGAPFFGQPRPVAFHGQHMYAIGESHANVLYASLAYGTTVSLPLPTSDCWSLFMDDALNKAFTLSGADTGYITPSDIKSDGTFDSTGHGTIPLGLLNGPSLDTNLHLLYAGSLQGLQIYDAATEQKITPEYLDSSLSGAIPPGGTWADSENGLLLVVGVGDDMTKLGIYKVTVGS